MGKKDLPSRRKRATAGLIGVTLLLVAGLGFYLVESGRIAAGKAVCAACHRPLHKAQVYMVTSKNGVASPTCCPRCGLRFEIENGAQSVQATDFTTGNLVPAETAYYLEGSDIMECCSSTPFRTEPGIVCELHFDRCLPSLVAFSQGEKAEEYRRLHGGHIIHLAEARMSVSRQLGHNKGEKWKNIGPSTP